MPIKKVFTSAKVVYRTTVPRTGFGWANYFDLDPIDTLRIYEEYITAITGLSMARDETNPGSFKIRLHCLRKINPWPSWGASAVAELDGITGRFLGWNTAFAGGGIGGALTVREIVTDLQGHIWGWDRNLTLKKLNLKTHSWDSTGKGYSFFGASAGAFRSSSSPYMVNLPADRFVTRLSADSRSSLSICAYSTGDFLHRVFVCGRAEGLFAVDDQRAYAISEDGVVTVFDFVTGAVFGAFHSGIAQNVNNQAWSWDPVLRRILHCPHVPDTLPDGDCNIQVHGYYPVPLPIGMTPPIPLRAPRKGRAVPIYSRVYGGVGEGIPGQAITYSTEAPSGATVSPNRRNTAENGTTKTFLTGILAGANSITATTEVP